MRKIESLISNFLFLLFSCLFFYSTVAFFEFLLGKSDVTDYFLLPFKPNLFVYLGAVIFSAFAWLIFPLWDIGAYYNLAKISDITKAQKIYKREFLFYFLGFLGLLLINSYASIFFKITGTLLIIFVVFDFVYKKIPELKIQKFTEVH